MAEGRDRGGRPRRYDLSEVAVGASTLIPWRTDAAGLKLPDQEAVHQAVRREARRLGWTFARAGRAQGLVVTRVA